jgi:hypothetical protein
MRGKPFVKGQPKPAGSGRRAGVPNKAKYKRVAEILAEAGISPAGEIIDCIQLMDEPKDRAKAWADLLAYCEAKPKAREDDPNAEPDPDEFKELSSGDLLKIVKRDGGS